MTTTHDRDSLRSVGATFERLVPQDDLREAILGAFADLIETAHAANPASWQLTAHRQGTLNLNVGPVSSLHLLGDGQARLLVPTDLQASPGERFEAWAPFDYDLRELPGATFRVAALEDLVADWPDLRAFAMLAAERAARKSARTRYFRYHSSGFARLIESYVGRALPEPDYTRPEVPKLVEVLHRSYPAWANFLDAAYVRDEADYKRRAAEKAAVALDAAVLAKLLEEEDYEEILRRVKVVGRSTTLLYQGNPSQGDLNILEHPDLEMPAFCRAFVDLLHGPGDGPDRLGRYLEWLHSTDLPSKWPFPTYFLFLLHPHHEILVKPEATQRFFRLVGRELRVSGKVPNAETYRTIRTLAQQLFSAFTDAGHQPRDLIDIQSLLWVCHRMTADGDMPELAEPPDDSPVSTQDTEGPPAAQQLEDGLSPRIPREVFLNQTGVPDEELDRWLRALERKRQIVLYGPPGTGKTFLARHLARFVVGGSRGSWELVQFHPAYSYEDFVQGIRPTLDGGQTTYELTDGRFLEVCKRAQVCHPDPCVLIIDELNRANLSQVFGELMYLLEYREDSARLASGEHFKIPENLHLIATMNTADRSIALVDHALRRRFAFLKLEPRYEILEGFHARQETGYDTAPLIELLKELNQAIDDPAFSVGVSFFLRDNLRDELEDIWRMEIEPYLEEFFFNDRKTIERFRWRELRRGLAG